MCIRRLAVLLVLALGCAAPAAAQGEGPRLFGPTLGDRVLVAPSDRTTTQARVVRPDLARIDQLARDHARTGERVAFVLDLFDGLDLEAEVIGADIRATGTTVFARLKNVELGSAVLTYESGVLLGTVTFPGGEYMIEQQSDGLYRVARKAPERFPPEAEPRIHVPRNLSQESAPEADVPADSGRLIDVMIVWTPAAQTAAGGLAQIQAIAQGAIDSSNSIYLNSGVAQRLRLVHSQQVTYTETISCGASAFDCALDDLTNPADGPLDEVHALRSTHGADLVSILISDNAYCGIAWLPHPPSAGTSNQGFSVVEQSCAVGNKSFAHELGHNMGAHHDPFVLSGGPCSDGKEAGAYCFSRGYVYNAGGWRTVMAYANQCPSCNRIAHFSNPSLTMGGAAMGDAAYRNNAYTLNKTAKAVAGYRPTSALHPVTQRFTDVATSNAIYGYIEFFAQAGITSSCAAGQFCPASSVTRDQMAVFLERGKRASNWSPPAATGLFTDVPTSNAFAPWIEALKNDAITGGCTATTYCPTLEVTRGQMAVFVLRARCGSSYVPNLPASATFADVPTSHPFFRYVEKIYALGITSGCLSGPLRYCPDAPVTRGQMAVFVERAYPFLTPSETCAP
jgi:hypothetical protein